MKWLAIVLGLASLTACHKPAPALPAYGHVPDFQLTSQNGQTFSSTSLKGNVWVADFMFTNCMGPCPRMSSRLHEIQQQTGDLADVRLVSFTVDPANDTPAVLAAYAKEHAASPQRWFFLTGPQQTLNHLCRQVFLLGNVDGSLNHSTKFTLIDKTMQIRGYYDSFDPDNLKQLVDDVHTLARERS